jgi:hypothetical protein
MEDERRPEARPYDWNGYTPARGSGTGRDAAEVPAASSVGGDR